MIGARCGMTTGAGVVLSQYTLGVCDRAVSLALTQYAECTNPTTSASRSIPRTHERDSAMA
jgi:hypothetical protein